MILLWLRAHWRAVAIAGGLLTAAAVFAFCRAPDPAPLPPALERQVARHQVATAVDTAETHRLERVAAAAQLAQRRDSIRAAQLVIAAAVQGRRADSLARVAASSASAHDSAVRYQAAYDARSLEADTLRTALEAKTSEAAHATQRGDSLQVALVRSDRRAARADSVIAAAVDVVRHSEAPCRVARFFACPSRTEAAVGGAVVGALAATIVGRSLVRTQHTAVTLGR